MHINITCRELNLSKDIITREILEKILKEGQNLLVITKDTILTPLAMDLINKENIKLDYRDDVILDNPDNDFSKIKEIIYDIGKVPVELILKFYTLMLKIRLFEEVVKVLKEKEKSAKSGQQRGVDDTERDKQIAIADACSEKYNSCLEKCTDGSCENKCSDTLSTCEKNLPLDLKTIK